MILNWFGPLLAITGSTKTPEKFLPKPFEYYKTIGQKVIQHIEKQRSKDDIKKIVQGKFAEYIGTNLLIT